MSIRLAVDGIKGGGGVAVDINDLKDQQCADNR